MEIKEDRLRTKRLTVKVDCEDRKLMREATIELLDEALDRGWDISSIGFVVNEISLYGDGEEYSSEDKPTNS